MTSHRFGVTFSGAGKIPRAIRELQSLTARQAAAQASGTLTQQTTRGTITSARPAPRPADPTPRWG